MSKVTGEEKFTSLEVGKTYAEIEDDGRLGVLYACVDSYEEAQYGPRVFVMVDEDSPDSEPRYISGRSATTEFWKAQL